MDIKGWMQRWFKREPILQPVWSHMGYRPGPALLSNEAYKKVGYVYRCVRVLSECAQQIPVFAASRDSSTGRMVRLPGQHPLSQLLEKPNHEDDFAAIIESIVTNLNLHGEAILELESPATLMQIGSKAAPPTRIWSHPAQWIAKVDVEDGRYSKFHLRARGFERTLMGDQAAFFRMLHPDDPWRGLAPLSAAYQAADTFYAANLFNAKFFENGAVPSLALTYDVNSRIEQLDAVQRERIRSEIQRLHGGIDNAHGVAVLGPGENLEEIGGKLQDMFFQTLMKFNRSEILAVFGVPLMMLGDPEGANRANSQEQIRMFWLSTEIPFVEDVASLFNRKVAKRFGQDCAAIFDYQQVPALQKDMGAMVSAAVPMIQNGVLTINEVRTDQLNKQPVPWGDVWWHNANTVPTDGLSPEADGTPEDGETPPPASSNNSIDPKVACQILGEWKNSTIMRIRDGHGRSAMEAFPVNREATKAVRKFKIPAKAAWELARLALTEMALEWDLDAPQDGVADWFDKHIDAMRQKALTV